MIRVGCKKPGGGYVYSYTDVDFDKNGWADATKYLPDEFDLCYLRTDSGMKIGWFCGNGWDGKTVEKWDVITKWKRNKTYQEFR